MKTKIDIIRIREGKITINGWAIGKSPEETIDFAVFDMEKRKLDIEFVRTRRDDVSKIHFQEVYDKDFGFDIRFPYDDTKTYYVHMLSGNDKKIIKLNKEIIQKRASVSYKRREKIKDLVNLETLRVVWDYFKQYGLQALIRKSKNKLAGIDNEYEYGEWYEQVKPTQEVLAKQREEKFEKEPLISIIIPLYNTPDKFLKELIDSILLQTYSKFEVCFADGSDAGKEKEAVVMAYRDNRILYKKLEKNLGISENTNAAMDMAGGEYIALCDHDDVLTPDALYEVVKAVNTHNADFIYSDEDKLDMDGGSLFDPHFKPDFNLDLLRNVNYICHLTVIHRDLIAAYGKFDARFDGAQDYDFFLRMTENARKIYHIPKVLYHWRCHMASTASNPESKLYAFKAGERAIEEHLNRVYPHMKVASIEKGIDYGIYHTRFNLKEKPLVSVIIPNKDHVADLDKAIRSLYVEGLYKNLEFIVVENNSTDEKTFAYYKALEKEFSNVKVVYWQHEFNYSKINNFGMQYASGEYILFLNNDVELIAKDSVEEMLYYVMRDDVGICGARLLYEDGSIQHAGVVLGFGGIAGHTFIGRYPEEGSYFHRAMTVQNYSAVTAACLMTKREVFEKVGGFSEELAVAFNDIDFCMKVREAGYLIVYNPYVSFYHYESKSRGLEDTPEKVERFNREIATFLKSWSKHLQKGDSYYNPNLTLRKSDFSLRDLLKENIGEPYHIKDIEKYM